MQWQKFQFPTGWNSTLANQAGMSEEAFQFPTGWNSTSWNKQYPGFFKMFQFPTGWNSTKFSQERKPTPSVSIPNGMEFYSIRHNLARRQRPVSIPNGMEFYARHRYERAFWKSFNSQRDGILLSSSLNLKVLPKVSIPNGMKFYMDGGV